MRVVERGRALDCHDVQLATDTAVFDAAFRLVHDQYVARGYMAPAASGRRLSIFNALPSTKVFVLRRCRRVVGTLSLIEDSRLGLPMDEIYHPELTELRAAGHGLGEVSALALAGGEEARGLRLLMRLVRVMVIYAAHVARLDYLCIAVNPRHRDFYWKVFAFEPFGPTRHYAKVNGAPAVGLRLDLEAFRRQTLPLPRSIGEFMFAAPAREQILAVLDRELPWSVLTPDQFAYFFEDGEAFASAEPWAVRMVSRLYARRFPGVAEVAAAMPAPQGAAWHERVTQPHAAGTRP
ncbi:MAG TPA: hypothetical protein VNO23_04120 [Candidatus Binatia bacterium]|nr:hypothetical protein [Candidatus Binatia bacterium]